LLTAVVGCVHKCLQYNREDKDKTHDAGGLFTIDCMKMIMSPLVEQVDTAVPQLVQLSLQPQGSYRPWKVLESPEIKMLRFPGLESPGKRHRSWKTLEMSWNSKVVVLKILLYGSDIAS